MAKSPVDIANEQVSIGYVLLQMGVDIPDYSSGASWKANCPFEEFYHIDQGRSKSLRVYFATNSAYCFAGCGYLTPVTLYALKTGLPKAESAMLLLQANGLELPSLDDELEHIMSLKNSISKASLREALQIFCQKSVGGKWHSVQFNDDILTGLDNCLQLLDKVDSEERARIWLTRSKEYMSALLKGKKYV